MPSSVEDLRQRGRVVMVEMVGIVQVGRVEAGHLRRPRDQVGHRGLARQADLEGVQAGGIAGTVAQGLGIGVWRRRVFRPGIGTKFGIASPFQRRSQDTVDQAGRRCSCRVAAARARPRGHAPRARRGSSRCSASVSWTRPGIGQDQLARAVDMDPGGAGQPGQAAEAGEATGSARASRRRCGRSPRNRHHPPAPACSAQVAAQAGQAGLR